KSVTSMLVGLALQRGRLRSLDEPVRHLLPHAVASVPGSVLAGVSLRQILQGRTGAAFEIARAAEMLGAAEPLRFALRACRVAPPSRSGWTYNDAAISLLSPILQVAEGASLASLASRALFAPLGIRRFAWRRDLRDRPLAHAGLALRPRDLAKLAWLMLQHGRWQDRERLPADWVAESTRSHGPVEWRAPPMQDLGYGHLWFTGRLQARPLVWAQGYGGQFALIAPAQRLVVATAATSPAPQKAAVQMQAVRALLARIVLAAA
ncbi:MAG TPA: serine hydrolase domain-containing protein, partial [Rhizobacter sp.]